MLTIVTDQPLQPDSSQPSTSTDVGDRDGRRKGECYSHKEPRETNAGKDSDCNQG